MKQSAVLGGLGGGPLIGSYWSCHGNGIDAMCAKREAHCGLAMFGGPGAALHPHPVPERVVIMRSQSHHT